MPVMLPRGPSLAESIRASHGLLPETIHDSSRAFPFSPSSVSYSGEVSRSNTCASESFGASEEALAPVSICHRSWSSSSSAGNRGSSKYDFVKVRVWLGPPRARHYYVLSRFLLSRLLASCRVPPTVALRLALDLKKRLVDGGMLNLEQAQLEAQLFALLHEQGVGSGPDLQRRYALAVARLHLQQPLLVVVGGAPMIGKSLFVQQLAARLNVTNVLQADLILEMLACSGLCQLPERPVWLSEPEAGRFEGEPRAAACSTSSRPPAAQIEAFERCCAAVRRALEGDLKKCFHEGKSLVIEGAHVDVGGIVRELQEQGWRCGSLGEREELVRSQKHCSDAASLAAPSSSPIYLTGPSSLPEGPHAVRIAPLVVPVVLVAPRSSASARDVEGAIRNWHCAAAAAGVPVFDLDRENPERTLEALHEHVLGCMDAQHAALRREGDD
ncbi:hypothetical protein H632_c147p1 [Helicosporidium sp. ATCC 50920]|nr:hypothetical protein H632_c147p1 [Helicosporidium sp. ATCC 50920]|eukprot:KDD76655.1 hypothetical protein H632_c147p1 [Helicosporidium sp. ATCC 50920]